MATTRVAIAPMKAAQVRKPGGDFEIVEREVPQPGAGNVRIKVQACGVCHSDIFQISAVAEIPPAARQALSVLTAMPAHSRALALLPFGYTGAQLVDHPHDFVPRNTGVLNPRPSSFFDELTGISFDGGDQEYMVAPVEALAAIPESLDAAEAAPLLCAGITTYNALRHSGALPGDLVAVLGVGGLGHLGIQFASKFGYKVAAVGRGPENAALAKKLGASVYIDSKATNAAEELQKLGGAQVILATAPSSKADRKSTRLNSSH